MRFNVEWADEYLCSHLQRIVDKATIPSDFSSTAFTNQLTAVLKNIINELQKGTTPQEREKSLLNTLAESATRCAPTWLETAMRVLGDLQGAEESVPNAMLNYVQRYKEEHILAIYQTEGTQWHTLNSARNILEEALGLDISTSASDPYAEQTASSIRRYYLKWRLLEQYDNTNKLIASIHSSIHAKPYDGSYMVCLRNLVEAAGTQEDATEYVIEHFSEGPDLRINTLGINFILKHMGILK